MSSMLVSTSVQPAGTGLTRPRRPLGRQGAAHLAQIMEDLITIAEDLGDSRSVFTLGVSMEMCVHNAAGSMTAG